MDFDCLEALLGLPEFRVIDQVLNPQQLDLHLERPVTLWLHRRRFNCGACHHRPWEKSETFGARVKWTERLYNQVRQEFLHGCPGKELASRYGLSARTVFRWTFDKSRGGRPRKLGRALGIDAY